MIAAATQIESTVVTDLVLIFASAARVALLVQRIKLAVRHCVAVGTTLSGSPPHRSQRAELPHWALTLGSDAQALIGIRMTDSRLRKEPLSQSVHSRPQVTASLASPPQGEIPEPQHLKSKRTHHPPARLH
jgi:hypothetical protein